MTHRRSGFTLLEISIVLVIISLIIGGIVGAQSMIRAAQLRSALTELDIQVQAIKEFQTKYNALPGDMSNAESNWGSDASCPGTPANLAQKTATCNGNGDGRIGASTTTGVLSGTTEWYRAWQQMANAGFIPGKFSGTASTATNPLAPGVTVPGSKVKGGAWMLFYFLLTTTNTSLWADQYGHVMMLTGGYNAAATSGKFPPIMTPGEAMELDGKVDDGKAGTGSVRVWRNASMPLCISWGSEASPPSATYNTTNTRQACSMMFILGM